MGSNGIFDRLSFANAPCGDRWRDRRYLAWRKTYPEYGTHRNMAHGDRKACKHGSPSILGLLDIVAHPFELDLPLLQSVMSRPRHQC